MLKFSVHNDDDKYDAIYTFLFRLKEDSIVSDILTLNNSLKKVKKNINILKKKIIFLLILFNSKKRNFRRAIKDI